MLVVILCARYEEARHARLVLTKAGLNVREAIVNSALHHETEMTDIHNNKLTIEIYSTDRMGSPEASIATVQLIINRKPYWIFMTGVCAGHPKKTSLGDVIVAESAVDIRSGKIGLHGIAHDSYVHRINRYLNQFIQSIREKLETSPDIWNELLTVKRPITRRHKMDAILNLLFSHKLSIVASAGAAAVAASIVWQLLQSVFSHRPRGSIPRSEVQRQMATLCNQGECTELLDKLVERKEITHDEKDDVFYLNDEQTKQVQKMVQRDAFPKSDPALPKIISGVLGTDSLVVANMQSQDWVDLEKELAQRNLVAIEMEASGLYNATAAMNESNNNRNNPITQTILVKGVSDLASPDKDDQFHDYGKQVSAVFVYQFLYHYGHTAARQHQKGETLSSIIDEKSTELIHESYKLDTRLEQTDSKNETSDQLGTNDRNTRWHHIALFIVNSNNETGTGFLAKLDDREFILTCNHLILNQDTARLARAFFDYDGGIHFSRHGSVPAAPATDIIFEPESFYIASNVLDYSAIGYSMDPKSKYLSRKDMAVILVLDECCSGRWVNTWHHQSAKSLRRTSGKTYSITRLMFNREEIDHPAYRCHLSHSCHTGYGSSGGLITCVFHDSPYAIHLGKIFDTTCSRFVTTNNSVRLDRVALDMMNQLDSSTRSSQSMHKSNSSLIPRIDPRLNLFESYFVPTALTTCWVKKYLTSKYGDVKYDSINIKPGGLFNITVTLENTSSTVTVFNRNAMGEFERLESEEDIKINPNTHIVSGQILIQPTVTNIEMIRLHKQVVMFDSQTLKEVKIGVTEGTCSKYKNVSRVSGTKLKRECFTGDIPGELITFVLKLISDVPIEENVVVTHQTSIIRFIPVYKVNCPCEVRTMWFVGCGHEPQFLGE